MKYPKTIQSVADAYNQITTHFSMTRGHGWKEFNEFASYLNDNNSVLDLGCGNGRLHDSLPTTISYTGLDVSKELLQLAKQLHPNEHFVEGSMTELPFKNEAFNHAFAIASLQHLPTYADRKNCIKEVHRAIKKDGYFFISNWDIEFSKHKKSLFTIVRDWIFSKGTYGKYDYSIPWKSAQGETQADRYYHYFTKKEITTLLKENGFIIEKFFKSDVSPHNRNICIIAKKV